MAVVPFTKDKAKAESCADEIISHGKPAAVISIEAPGENKIGVYHNATGLDVTHLEAKWISFSISFATWACSISQ